MRNKILVWCSLAIFAMAAMYFSGIGTSTVKADKGAARLLTTTPQTLPFSQNWSNAGLITTNDDWSGVPGIMGYRGDDVVTVIGTDISTVFADNSAVIDVNANQTNPDTFTTGGVAEFDTIANPAVALNGSGTADLPGIVIYLNTTGNSNIQFACNIRDLDASADDATQQINVQYRVGGTGNYANVPGGYIADATTANTATQVTPLNLTLPAAANNQALVEVRVITVNAPANDEWVGIDDISVTAAPAITPQHVVDLDGDGKTDYVVVRNTGGGPGGQITWFGQQNGGAAQTYVPWGIASDEFVPEDYDGDGKTDIAIWRSGPAGNAGWYIVQSQTSTIRQEAYGQAGDDPSVVGDYDGDNKADLAVYRAGANSGDPSFWYYRVTPGGPVFGRQWGQNGDFPAPGDYDGDGKDDFGVQRNGGGGQANFFFNYNAAAPGVLSNLTRFGTPTDVVTPGDYDGDGKTDVATSRGSGGNILWMYQPSTALGTIVALNWGLSATDFRVQGDYDGDGKTDLAVWRPDADPNQNFFLIRKSSDGALQYQEWGSNGDYPVANFDNH